MMRSSDGVLYLLVLSLFWAFQAMGQPQSLQRSDSSAPISDADIQNLRYRVLAAMDIFACQPGSAQAHKQQAEQALSEFSAIQKDSEAFQAVTAHLGLQNRPALDLDEKMLIYCDYKRLQAIHLVASGNQFKVTMSGDQSDTPQSSASGTYINRDGQLQRRFVDVAAHGESGPLGNLPPQPSSRPPRESVPFVKPVEQPELRYRLLDRFGAFLCPDDSGPAYNPLEKRKWMLESFSGVQKDNPTFRLIAQHLKLNGVAEFTPEQKIDAYHEYIKLTHIRLEPLLEKFEFSLCGPDTESHRPGVGAMTSGLIDPQGKVTVLQKQPCALVCPL
jgi:hypothetical protein